MKKKTLMALAFGLIIVTAEGSRADFLEYNGHFYGLTTVRSDWVNAQEQAVALGGHLVVINDANEQNFLTSNFSNSNTGNLPLWIGLSDSLEEGVFRWVNGDDFTYTNWNPGEPNNDSGRYPSHEEDYVAMNWHYAIYPNTNVPGTWNDLPIDGNVRWDLPVNFLGIVEISPAPVPEPSTILLFGIGASGLAAVGRRRRV